MPGLAWFQHQVAQMTLKIIKETVCFAPSDCIPDLLHNSRQNVPSIVDQNVDASKMLDGFVDGFLDLFAGGCYVERNAVRPFNAARLVSDAI